MVRVAPYVHGSGPDGSSKSARLPEPTLRKSGRDLVAHFRTDLNCRVRSRGDNGTVGTGRSLYIPSWADRDPEIPRGTGVGSLLGAQLALVLSRRWIDEWLAEFRSQLN